MANSLRRRLTLVCSSDEEEEQQQHNYVNNHQPPPNPNEPVTISDDDAEFFDIPPDDLTPPPPPIASVELPSPGDAAAGYPISSILLKLGLNLKREWLQSCVESLERKVLGFSGLGDEAKAKLCFGQFLFVDMNCWGGGLLPPNVGSMHLVELAGPFVLQVDEIVNISCPLRGRYHNESPGIKRCLKLSMTDGAQRVIGMEYRPIKDLQVLAPAGLKVVICNVHIRHGILMLVHEAFEVLGGSVEELEAARKRLVEEVNKPARGRRRRNGTLPPLATRATGAAWPSNGANTASHTRISIPHSATSLATGQGATLSTPVRNTSDLNTEVITVSRDGEHHMSDASDNIAMDVEEIQVDTVPSNNQNEHSQGNNEGLILPTRGLNVPSYVEEVFPPIRDQNVPSTSLCTAALHVESIEEDEVPVNNGAPSADTPDTVMINDIEHPLILYGARETPFTYLASLSAKWAAKKDKTVSVQGKVKCLLTGVKGFQYKQRTSYDLRVYVDDGSLISEILIDHNVVEKGIGHSPEKVTAALSSSDKQIVNDMKETLKQFQIFLANFEGTMLLEMNETYPLPIALEMNQGCPASDAWLLLRRLKSCMQTPDHLPVDNPIDISP